MLPGDIPGEIAALIEPERRLLQRIISNVKVINFPGRFGQYGFKGHATLFAFDIFEVSEKLPEILPRSSTDVGMVVVIKTLKNLNLSRNYKKSPDRVYKVLDWLIANNPLYKYVQVNRFVRLNTQDIIRVIPAQPGQPHEPDDQITDALTSLAYMEINDLSRIVRASWNQNNEIFQSGHARHQRHGCCEFNSYSHSTTEAVLYKCFKSKMIADDGFYKRN